MVPGMFKVANLKTRFVITILSFVAIFFVLLVSGTVALTEHRLSQQVTLQLSRHAEDELEKLNLRLSFLLETTESFAESSLAINSLIDVSGRSSYFPQAVNELARLSEITTVVVFDFSGNVIAGNSSDYAQWFDVANARNTLIRGVTSLTFNSTRGTFLVNVPIKYYDTPQGGIAVEISASTLLVNILEKVNYGYLLTIGENWSMEQGTRGGSVIAADVQADIASLLGPYHVHLKASLPSAVAMEPVVESLKQLLLLGGISMLLLLLVAVKVGQRLARPILTLTERVQQDVHPCAPLGTGDQLEVLAQAFDQKTENLLQVKAELESRVAQRTLELEDKARVLAGRSEELFQVNQKLEMAHTELQKLDRMKDEFLSSVGRELRTPLGSIQGALGLVVGDKKLAERTKIRDLLKTALDNSARLELLINKLFDYQLLSSGDFKLVLKPLRAQQLIDQAISAVKGYSESRGVRVIHRNTDPNLYFKGDAKCMSQALDTLLSNAIKFSPRDSEVEVWTLPEGEQFKIYVLDRGERISLASGEHAFNGGAGDVLDSTKRSAADLGLILSKKVVEAQGGRLAYQNHGQGGVLFWLELSKVSIPESLEVFGNA